MHYVLLIKLDTRRDNSIAHEKHKFQYKSYWEYYTHAWILRCILEKVEITSQCRIYLASYLPALKYEVKHRQRCNIFVNVRTAGRDGSLRITWEPLCFVILIARHPGKNLRTFPTILSGWSFSLASTENAATWFPESINYVICVINRHLN